MITATDTHFEIRCDWIMCKTSHITGESAQEVTDKAVDIGWEMQIKRMGGGRQYVFYFCPEHAKRGREFDTEGMAIKVPKLGFLEKEK